ncbi:MAG TPA: hypothetical protein VH325_07790 [Bryobacteraceae bacterium]|jgi:hypothetical protein|nr:hypothetical protein [Bryobacteraceae bacterium]
MVSDERGCAAVRITGQRSAALFRLALFLVVVNRNRIQIFGLENLTAVKTADVIYAIASIEKLSSLVLATLHCEITPILV